MSDEWNGIGDVVDNDMHEDINMNEGRGRRPKMVFELKRNHTSGEAKLLQKQGR